MVDVHVVALLSADEMKAAAMLCASHSLCDIASHMNISNESIDDLVQLMLKKTGFPNVESFVQCLISTGESEKLMSVYVRVMCKYDFISALEHVNSISKQTHVNLYVGAADNKRVKAVYDYLRRAGVDTCVNIGIAGSNTIRVLLQCDRDYLYDRNKFDFAFDIDKESTYTVVLKIIGSAVEHEHVVKTLREIKSVERRYHRNVRCKGLLYICGVIMNNKTIKCTTAISTVLLLTIAVKSQDRTPREVRQISHAAAALQESAILHRIGMNAKINDAWHNNEASCVVLVGPGGAGKTTLSRGMIESKKYDVAYELNAESDIVLTESLSRLAGELAKANGRLVDLKIAIQGSPDEKKRKTMEFIRTSLMDCKNWLLVYDNVDEADVLDGVFPIDRTWGNGRVLITTRNKNITSGDFSIPTKIIDVELLSDDEKYALFTKICDDTKYRKEDILQLLSAVPGYPLDVSTVACELKSGDYSLDEYKAKLEAVNSLDEIDESLMTDSSAYGKTRYGINVATLNRILEEHKDDADVKAALLMMSMCYSQKFPLKAFTLFRDEGLKNKIISSLKKYSFISEDANSISMHRSVQEIWFNLLSRALDPQLMKSMLDRYIDTVINYEEAACFFERISYKRDSAYSNAMKASYLRSVELIEKLNLEEHDKKKYVSKVLLAYLHLQNIGKVGTNELRRLSNTLLEIDEEYNSLSRREKAMLYSIIAGNERMSNIKRCEEFATRAVATADLCEGDTPCQVMSRVYLSDALYMQGKTLESANVLNRASEILRGEYKKASEELWFKQLYAQVEYVKISQHANRNLFNKLLAEEAAARLIPLMKMLDGLNIREAPITGAVSWMLPVLKFSICEQYLRSENYKEVENAYADMKHFYDNYDNISPYMYLGAYSCYCNALVRQNKIIEAFKQSKSCMAQSISFNCEAWMLSFGAACYSEAAVRIGAPEEAISSSSSLLTMKPFIGLENVKSQEVGGKRLRMIEYFARCMFNAAVACKKLERSDEANMFFEKSIKSLRILAEKTYSDEKIDAIDKEGIFNISTDVNENLAKGKYLFKMIYGEDHSLNKHYLDKI